VRPIPPTGWPGSGSPKSFSASSPRPAPGVRVRRGPGVESGGPRSLFFFPSGSASRALKAWLAGAGAKQSGLKCRRTGRPALLRRSRRAPVPWRARTSTLPRCSGFESADHPLDAWDPPVPSELCCSTPAPASAPEWPCAPVSRPRRAALPGPPWRGGRVPPQMLLTCARQTNWLAAGPVNQPTRFFRDRHDVGPPWTNPTSSPAPRAPREADGGGYPRRVRHRTVTCPVSHSRRPLSRPAAAAVLHVVAPAPPARVRKLEPSGKRDFPKARRPPRTPPV